jgi:hypothetical protein
VGGQAVVVLEKLQVVHIVASPLMVHLIAAPEANTGLLLNLARSSFDKPDLFFSRHSPNMLDGALASRDVCAPSPSQPTPRFPNWG